MYRRPFSLSRKLLVATALSLIACGVALADDSSTSRFGGDGYAYFAQPVRDGTATAAAWRQNHPTGLSQRELQAASSSALAASASQIDTANVIVSAPADASWRQSHPYGLTQRELQAAGASSLAVWQLPDGSEPGSANVAQFRSKQRR